MYGELEISPNINIMYLDSQHAFVQGLIDAYRREYELRVLLFGYKRLKWFRRIAYTDR